MRSNKNKNRKDKKKNNRPPQLKQLRCTMDARGHLIGRNCRAANVAPAGNAAPYLVQQPTASSSPEGAADERTRNETGPEVIAADAFPGGSARLGK